MTKYINLTTLSCGRQKPPQKLALCDTIFAPESEEVKVRYGVESISLLGLSIIIVILFVVLGIILVVTMKLQAKRAMKVLNKFEGRKVLDIQSCANFFGQESLGHTQVRGNGVLVVTEDEIYFEMWVPKREFRILVSSIQSIETPRSHLGKTKGHPLLKVIFQNEKGERDSMAWLVKDVYSCKERLEKIIKQNSR